MAIGQEVRRRPSSRRHAEAAVRRTEATRARCTRLRWAGPSSARASRRPTSKVRTRSWRGRTPTGRRASIALGDPRGVDDRLEARERGVAHGCPPRGPRPGLRRPDRVRPPRRPGAGAAHPGGGHEGGQADVGGAAGQPGRTQAGEESRGRSAPPASEAMSGLVTLRRLGSAPPTMNPPAECAAAEGPGGSSARTGTARGRAP